MNDTRFIQGARTSIENAVASEQKLGHGIANIFNKTISPGDGGTHTGPNLCEEYSRKEELC